MLDDLFRDRPSLPVALDGTVISVQTPEGRVRCYAAGSGPGTILLLHGIGAIGSSYEMRLLFEHFARSRRSVALDWLGFGASERPERTYRATVYESVLGAVSSWLTGPGDAPATGPGRIDVAAVGLASQYVAVSAARNPTRFGRLVFISPTGLGRFARTPGLTAKTSGAALRLPGLGQSVYDGITSRRGIRRAFENMFADPTRILPQDERFAWVSARQPGARFAPLSWLAGLLDDPTAKEAFQKLDSETLLIFGERARNSDLQAGHDLARQRPNVTVEVVPTSGDLPHLERPGHTAALVSGWLSTGSNRR